MQFLFVLVHFFWVWTEPASLYITPPPLTQDFPKPLISGTSCAAYLGVSLPPGIAAALLHPQSCLLSCNSVKLSYNPPSVTTRAGCNSPSSNVAPSVLAAETSCLCGHIVEMGKALLDVSLPLPEEGHIPFGPFGWFPAYICNVPYSGLSLPQMPIRYCSFSRKT